MALAVGAPASDSPPSAHRDGVFEVPSPPVREVTKPHTQVNALEKMKKLAKSAPRSCAWVAADPGHRCDERGTVAAEDACHAACYAQELKNLKRETWSAQQPLRAP